MTLKARLAKIEAKLPRVDKPWMTVEEDYNQPGIYHLLKELSFGRQDPENIEKTFSQAELDAITDYQVIVISWTKGWIPDEDAVAMGSPK